MKYFEKTPRRMLSVITPVYNGAEYVAQAMQSVAQSVIDENIFVEHLLIDDGSTDASVEVIKRTQLTLSDSAHGYDSRLLRIDHSGKPAFVRNRGIEAARGNHVFCLDHDDVLLQNALRYLARYIETDSLDVVYGDFLRCHASLKYLIGDDYCGRSYRDAHAALLSLFKGEHFFQHSMMFTRRLWENVGGYDEDITFGEDFDLCVRFILAGSIPQHVPVTTHMHRNHENSLTACYLDKSVCPVWAAEHQAHYLKHRDALTLNFSEAEMAEVRRVLHIAPDALLSGPPSQELAASLAAKV